MCPAVGPRSDCTARWRRGSRNVSCARLSASATKPTWPRRSWWWRRYRHHEPCPAARNGELPLGGTGVQRRGSTMSPHAPVVLDVAGLALNDDDRRRLQHPLTGGLILFARNWQDRRQLTELTLEAKSLRPDLLICVDHEGGRVQRFRSDGFTVLPPMRSLGELWMRDAMRATDAATAVGYVLGAELRACGVDLSFTPVLDLDHGGSTVIGDRAFHRDARVVALLAKSVMHGLLRAGMANCGKHFPGHGHVSADSHVDIPIDRRSAKALLGDDAAPYGWL